MHCAHVANFKAGLHLHDNRLLSPSHAACFPPHRGDGQAGDMVSGQLKGSGDGVGRTRRHLLPRNILSPSTHEHTDDRRKCAGRQNCQQRVKRLRRGCVEHVNLGLIAAATAAAAALTDHDVISTPPSEVDQGRKKSPSSKGNYSLQKHTRCQGEHHLAGDSQCNSKQRLECAHLGNSATRL
jgi:hypothetical protein